jgi:hypothetical protein
MPDDVFHLPFAVDLSRDAFERIHNLRIHPLVHILDDFVIMIIMRVHIQGLLGLRREFFLALGDGDNIAVVFVFERIGAAAAAAFLGIPVGKTFNHPDMITENILDADEREDKEYA